MDSSPLKSSGLKAGDGMGDFMRFTTDAPVRFTTDAPVGDGGPVVTPDGFTRWPVNEPAVRRLSRIGMFRRSAGRGLRRIV